MDKRIDGVVETQVSKICFMVSNRVTGQMKQFSQEWRAKKLAQEWRAINKSNGAK